MDYTKFKIENFKGIRSLEFNVKGELSRIFTLVGLNESGKTTLLEAMAYWYETLTNNKGENVLYKTDISDVHNLIPRGRQHNFTDKIFIEATTILSQDDVDELDKIFRKHGFSIVKEVLNYEVKHSVSYEFEQSEYISAKPSRFLLKT